MELRGHIRHSTKGHIKVEGDDQEPSEANYLCEPIMMNGPDGRGSNSKLVVDSQLTIQEYVSPKKTRHAHLRCSDQQKHPKTALNCENTVMLPEEEDASLRTPVITRKDVEKLNPDNKSDQHCCTHSFDISPFIKSARYGQQDQKFRLFWLPNSEISSLMRIPSIAQMSSTRKGSTESLYIVFTPGGMDVIQDASHVAGVECRPFHTPFVVLYSYSFRSMYFKVVGRVIGSCYSITFDENGESGTVKRDHDSANESHSRNRTQPPSENQTYEFYRTYLYGIDDGATTRRIMVSLRNVKETVLDMRDASVADEASGRHKSTVHSREKQADLIHSIQNRSKQKNTLPRSANRRGIDLPSSRSSDSMDFDGGVSARNTQLSRDGKRISSRNCWIYEANDDHEGSDDEMVSGLPVVLVSEIKRIIGFEDVSKLLQCNLSMVTQRMESMIKRNFMLYDRDDNCIVDNVKGKFETVTNSREGSKAMYRIGDHTINVGDVLVVKFPSLYKTHLAEDTIKIYDSDTLCRCFKTLESLSSDKLTDNTMTLAQYCPNIFWNLVLTGDVEQALSEMAPNLCEHAHKRRRRLKNNVITDISKSARVVSKPNTAPVFDNNFVIMQNLFEHDAQIKIERLKQLHRQQRNSNGKMTRHSISKYVDDSQLVETVMDPDGFLLKSMETLTPQQKLVIYQACLRRGIYAPIRLDYISGKGRAVFAAYDIGKDEFIVEYKGQIITEKVAKFRDQKYDQSRSYKGSFVFYFKVKTKRYCIDATEEDIMFGPARLINHSRKNPNIVPKALEIDGCPRLFFVAKRNIKSGEELLIDYGERDPSVIKDNPWLLD